MDSGKDWRYGVGVVTIVGVLGLTAYSIYLWRKQQKVEEESISVEEAQEIVKNEKNDISEDIKVKDPENSQGLVFEDENGEPELIKQVNKNNFERQEQHQRDRELVNEVVDYYKKQPIARPKAEVEEEQRLEDERQVEEEIRAEQELWDPEPEPVLLEDEGDGKLRYDPNSDEALEQFVRMELAEWTPNEDTYQTMRLIFDINYFPTNDGDRNVWENLMDHRSEFFGPASRWAQLVTFGDLMIYYARKLDFNLGGGVRYWVDEMVGANELDEYDRDELVEVMSAMNNHIFHNEKYNTYGLFSLNPANMRNIEKLAAEMIDESITFDMEYNEFLKQYN